MSGDKSIKNAIAVNNNCPHQPGRDKMMKQPWQERIQYNIFCDVICRLEDEIWYIGNRKWQNQGLQAFIHELSMELGWRR